MVTYLLNLFLETVLGKESSGKGIVLMCPGAYFKVVENQNSSQFFLRLIELGTIFQLSTVPFIVFKSQI